MASPAPGHQVDAVPRPPGTTSLGAQERAVLIALVDCRGRVVSRRELARRAGLDGLNERRCDSLIVGIRRALGSDAIRTVRSRGWMLEDRSIPLARDLIDQRRT